MNDDSPTEYSPTGYMYSSPPNNSLSGSTGRRFYLMTDYARLRRLAQLPPAWAPIVWEPLRPTPQALAQSRNIELLGRKSARWK